MNHLQAISRNVNRPNSGSVTRRGRIIAIYLWIGKHASIFGNQYHEPGDCVDNDDGSRRDCIMTMIILTFKLFNGYL